MEQVDRTQRRWHEIPRMRSIREIRRNRYRWSRGNADDGLLTWAHWRRHYCASDALMDCLSVETPRPDHGRRAVDVNQPVTPWCAPPAVPAARLQNVTGD
jgi:hypothetical protein